MSRTVTADTSVVCDREWTVDDLHLLPEGYRSELIEGVLYMAAMPAWPHPAVVENIRELLGDWVKAHGLGRVVGPQAGLYVSERNYVDPELLYLRKDQFPQRGARPTSAVIAVEVLSPSNRRAPKGDRERLFAQAGVEELWYADPAAKTLEIARLTQGCYEPVGTFSGDDEVTSSALPALRFSVDRCWRDGGS